MAPIALALSPALYLSNSVHMSVGNSYSRYNIPGSLHFNPKTNIWIDFILCYHFSINTIISISGQVENCKPGYYKDKVGYGQCLKHRE